MNEKKDRRAIQRRKYYESDGLQAVLHYLGDCLEGYLADSNPGGLKIDIYGHRHVAVGEMVHIIISPKYGTKGCIEIDGITIHAQHSCHRGIQVTRLGVMTVESNPKRLRKSRKDNRFSCSDNFPVAAFAQHPFLYQEKLFFKVTEFSKKGMTLMTSKSNATLFNGIHLRLTVCIPTTGLLEISGTIRNIKTHDGGKSLRVGFIYESDVRDFKGRAGEYLLMIHPGISPKELGQYGYRAVYISEKMIFKFVASSDDFNKVLEVRQAAYAANHDSFKSIKPGDLIDKFDDVSRNMFGQINGQTVASGRLTFPEGRKEYSELYAKYNIELPEWLWAARFVEASKISVIPTFRNTDIFLNITKFFLLAAAQAGYDYIVTVTLDTLLPTYKRMGAVELGITKYLTEHDVTLNVIYFKIREVVTGQNMPESIRQEYQSIGEFMHIDSESTLEDA